MTATQNCEKCGLVHPPLVECLAAVQTIMKGLLLKIGTIDRCPAPCGKTIYWVRHLSGSRAPYSETGLIHFADCVGKFKKTA